MIHGTLTANVKEKNDIEKWFVKIEWKNLSDLVDVRK